MNTNNNHSQDASTVKSDTRATQINRISLIFNQFGVFAIIILLCILGTIISPNFLTSQNILNILDSVAILGIVAVGVAFVIYCGQYGDMSVPMTMAISGIICIEFMRFGLWVGIFAALITGCILGAINGYVIGKLRVNAIIWTLAMNFMIEGSIRWFYKGTQIYPDVASSEVYDKGFFLPTMKAINPDVVNIDMTAVSEQFSGLARTYYYGIPLMLLIMIAFMIVGYIIMSKTKYGNKLKIIGSNFEVGKMTGIQTTKTIIITFMISSFCAATAGILITSVNKVGAYYVGAGYDFRAVTAIILGGMSLAGGRGSMIGVFGGVFLLGLISNILTLLGVGTFEQQMITGAIFIFVVAVNANSLRKVGRDDA